ncbi:exodeoxyribonuclease V subunit beta [Arhodomonas aquaeolei]|uniref:exodeoxyribonuclease V subunit beta n=1 Tax=Arhodomonas aquaeolei TaxID=2369 RepID=UPI00037665F0|nr:exodeoxyribonuclease V subunit beta [Arhodomonas aquaeolei]
MHALDIDTFPLSGLRLIEASAGTGKTFTIAALYLRLLLDAEPALGRDLDLRDILVVTFTEAATEELRERIRRRLRGAADAFAAGEAPGDDPVLQGLLARRDDHADCARRLSEMLTRMDEAPIHTIHGFCHRTLRENAFESGSLFRAEFIADEHHLRRALAEDFWRRRFYGCSEAYARWVRSEWATPEALLAAVKGYLDRHRLRVIPEPDDDALAALEQRFEATATRAAGLWREAGDEAVARLHEAAASKVLSASASAYRADRLAALRPLWATWFDAPHLPLPAGFELLTPQTQAGHVLKAAARRGTEPPAHPLFDACGELAALAAELAGARRIQVLHDALDCLREGLRERKRAEQVLSFDDLLTTLADALRGPHGSALADAVARRHPVALIDEFQDTDPEQYTIFQRIYAGREGCGLFMIGDPKQAIYSFRGADIFTYLRARRGTEADGGRFTLATNWRSTDSLVRGIDALFRRNPRRFIFDQGIDLPAVTAAGRADERPLTIDGATPTGLRVWFHERGEKERTIAKGRARERLAGACAARIAGMLASADAGRARLGDEPLRARDIAVLVRSHSEAEAVKSALDARGVASVHHSRESVFATEEARELGHILHAVAEPEDEGLLRAAVCTRLIGLSAAGFHEALRLGPPWEARLERFAGYRERWDRRGVLPMLHTLMHQEGMIRRVFALPDGERRMTNLLHLGELLQEAAAEHYGVTALLRWFQEQLDDPGAAGEAAELRLESDAELVKIVTIHKSKGLQYPVVLLPFIALGRAPDDATAPLFHPGDDELVLDLGSAELDAHRAQAYREAMAEELRLLYVALTRASHCCELAWGRYNDGEHAGLAYLLFPPPDPDGAPPVAELPDDDAALRAPWEALEAEHGGIVTVSALDNGGGTGTPATVGAPGRGRALALDGHVRQGWRLSSYSGLLTSHAGQLIEQPDHDAGDEVEPAAPDTPGEGIHAFPRGARAGTFFHRVLELADFTDPDDLAGHVTRLLPAYGFDRDWAATVTDHLSGVLATPLDDSGVTLGALDRGRRLDELAFFFPVRDVGAAELDEALPEVGDGRRPALTFGRLQGMLKGYIDLVFEHDGRYFVVDYKSNHLGGDAAAYTPERLARAVAASRYDLQYALYALAVHRFLRSRLPDYDYDRHFGGVRYLFLRGMTPAQGPATGVYRERPPRALIERLDALFSGDTEAA